jgi:hypothetical protein
VPALARLEVRACRRRRAPPRRSRHGSGRTAAPRRCPDRRSSRAARSCDRGAAGR